ncbi:hypothetical protein F3H97_05185 [Exiguobacterium sp. SRB7LM]|nr:hypothetical protein [Exiguobacterium sp. SRB7LM]
MKSINVHHYDTFSQEPGKGNLPKVVLYRDDLNNLEMQKTVFEVDFNKTTFLRIPL